MSIRHGDVIVDVYKGTRYKKSRHVVGLKCNKIGIKQQLNNELFVVSSKWISKNNNST